MFLTNVADWTARHRAGITLLAMFTFSFFCFAFVREYQFDHGRFWAPTANTLSRAWWLLAGVGGLVTALVVWLQGYEFFLFLRRREKGLCAACQYPADQSVNCSECGLNRAAIPMHASLRLCVVLVMVGLVLGVLAAAFLVWNDDCRAQAFFERTRAAGVKGPLLWQRTLVFRGVTITSFDDGSATTFD